MNDIQRTRTHHKPNPNPRHETGHQRPNSRTMSRNGRRIAAGVALSAAALGVNAVASSESNPSYLVDREAVEQMDPKERDRRYDTFYIHSDASTDEPTVAPDIYGVAQDYQNKYGLEGNLQDLREDLVAQNGGTAEVHDGDVFYLPRLESDK